MEKVYKDLSQVIYFQKENQSTSSTDSAEKEVKSEIQQRTDLIKEKGRKLALDLKRRKKFTALCRQIEPTAS